MLDPSLSAPTHPQHPPSPTAERFVQPPRPPNAWILYRSDKLRELPPIPPGNPPRVQGEVSKLISSMWKNESEAVRADYERRAEAKKAEHLQMYPGYRFHPMKKEDRERLRTEKRSEKDKDRSTGSRKPRHRSPPPYASGHPVPPLPPLIPIFQPELHYGPAGPSPPMSAASSPEDDSPLRHRPPHPNTISTVSATASDASTAPQTPISPNGAAPCYPIVPSGSDDTSTCEMPPPSTPSEVPSMPTPPADIPAQTIINIEDSVSIDAAALASAWTQSHDLALHDLLTRAAANAATADTDPSSSTGDFPDAAADTAALFQLSDIDTAALFQLSDIDPACLLAPPTGAVEVSMGTAQMAQQLATAPAREYTAFAQQDLFRFEFDGLAMPPLAAGSVASSTAASTATVEGSGAPRGSPPLSSPAASSSSNGDVLSPTTSSASLTATNTNPSNPGTNTPAATDLDPDFLSLLSAALVPADEHHPFILPQQFGLPHGFAQHSFGLGHHPHHPHHQHPWLGLRHGSGLGHHGLGLGLGLGQHHPGHLLGHDAPDLDALSLDMFDYLDFEPPPVVVASGDNAHAPGGLSRASPHPSQQQLQQQLQQQQQRRKKGSPAQQPPSSSPSSTSASTSSSSSGSSSSAPPTVLASAHNKAQNATPPSPSPASTKTRGRRVERRARRS